MEGKVIREVDGNIIFEVQVTPTIKDEKKIPRKEVERIERQSEEQKAFLTMANYVPTPDLLSEKDYKERMERLEVFLKSYPDSRHERKVKQMLDTLGAELDVVSLGGVKLDGVMLGGERYNANAYEFDTRIAERRIKDAAARREYLTALRMFEKYEVNFPQSDGRSGLKVVMLQVLNQYRDIVTENLTTLDRRLLERSNGLLNMALEERKKAERAIQEQTDAISKRMADEKSSLQTWITPDAYHKESLTSTLTRITALKGQLEAETPIAETSLAEVYREAWKKIANGKDEEKSAVLDALLDGVKGDNKRLPEPYLAKLRERAALSKNE